MAFCCPLPWGLVASLTLRALSYIYHMPSCPHDGALMSDHSTGGHVWCPHETGAHHITSWGRKPSCSSSRWVQHDWFAWMWGNGCHIDGTKGDIIVDDGLAVIGPSGLNSWNWLSMYDWVTLAVVWLHYNVH